jgi:hypothetical protein
MAAFYTDENVTLKLAGFLRQRGHACATTHEERRLSAPDPHQLLYAANRGWMLITHNRRDFALLHDAWLLWSNDWGVAPQHAGILNLEPLDDADEMARVVHELVSLPGVALANRLFDWKPETGWRPFPWRRR